jgi:tetrapyrrole methylase family protein/MazG family protein
VSDPAQQKPLPPPSSLPPIVRLVQIMAILRSPQGCPWDHKQTLQSLKPHLVEESHEVLDAIDSGDRKKLCDELGDLLLQVVFQSQLCAEEGAFTFDDVATAIVEKLIRRHPHVFGNTSAADADEVLRNWEEIKKTEKGGDRPRSTLEGVPKSLPALHRAHLIQKRAARVGFDWENAGGPLEKLDEEIGELREAAAAGDDNKIRDELGDLLFSVVNVSRFLGHNPEELLHAGIAKFTRRFQAIEDEVHRSGKKMSDHSLAELDEIWNRVKTAEKK